MYELYMFAQEVPGTSWEIPWAGIGALLAGTGSLLTGIAALKAAQQRRGNNETEKADTSNSSGDES